MRLQQSRRLLEASSDSAELAVHKTKFSLEIDRAAALRARARFPAPEGPAEMITTRLFHGTAHDFERFDEAHLGRSIKNPTTTFGFFFTESIEDALEWAKKSARTFAGGRDQRVVEARLHLSNPLEMSYEAFHYYLQRARASTIAKHRQGWINNGFDGLTVVRDGVRWYAAFDAQAIEVVDVLKGARLAQERLAARRCVLEAYHGTTATFERFRPSERGSFGAGVYLADEAAAREYADDGEVLRVRVTLNNPFRCAAGYEHDVELDSPGVAMVRQVLGWDEADRLFAEVAAGDGLFGREIQQALLAQGYDGVIATYDGGCQEIVVFNPDQVEILERQPAMEPAPRMEMAF